MVWLIVCQCSLEVQRLCDSRRDIAVHIWLRPEVRSPSSPCRAVADGYAYV